MKNENPIYRILISLLTLIFALVSVSLLLRIFLKLFDANQNAEFTQAVYSFTQPLISPFVNVFSAVEFSSGVLEISSILALLVYVLVGYLAIELIAFLAK